MIKHLNAISVREILLIMHWNVINQIIVQLIINFCIVFISNLLRTNNLKIEQKLQSAKHQFFAKQFKEAKESILEIIESNQ